VCDYHEIANLLYEYGFLIDAGDFEGIGQLLADARLISDGAPMDVRGADAIARHYARTTRCYEDTGTPKTKHVFSNVQIEIDEGRGVARGKANYMVFQQTDALPLQLIITGHYEHRFEKRGDAWRIAEKKFFVDQVGDLSHHLLFDLDTAQTDTPGAG
jgi:3-phenylpropionate/cinnamic acid dioxygenase small subunit